MAYCCWSIVVVVTCCCTGTKSVEGDWYDACLRETPAKQWTKTTPPLFLPLSMKSRQSSRWSSRFWEWISRSGTVFCFSLQFLFGEEEEGAAARGPLEAGLLKSRGSISWLMSERMWVTAAAGEEEGRSFSSPAALKTAAASVILPMYKPSLTFFIAPKTARQILYRSPARLDVLLPSSAGELEEALMPPLLFLSGILSILCGRSFCLCLCLSVSPTFAVSRAAASSSSPLAAIFFLGLRSLILSLPPSPQSAAAGARFLHILRNRIRV